MLIFLAPPPHFLVCLASVQSGAHSSSPPVNCVRLTYVGELGYELYVPAEQAVHVYDHILAVDKQQQTGLTHCGLRALGSLRQEKAYKDFGHDVVCVGCDSLRWFFRFCSLHACD